MDIALGRGNGSLLLYTTVNGKNQTVLLDKAFTNGLLYFTGKYVHCVMKKLTLYDFSIAKVNNNYRKNIKAFWKFVNRSIKSSVKNRIETLTDG